jgi:hypothetical protein
MNAKLERSLKSLKGKHVYAYRKDGSVISGKLVRTNDGYAIRIHRKHASTKALIPLVLLDLLAIGTEPYGYGYGYGYGYPPYYPGYGGHYPYGYGPIYYD